ncbi:MAG: alpha/beta fold hydrolase [Flavobacterium sp.]
MKHALLAFLFLLSCFANGQKLYIKTYGDKTKKALVFIHGGPGGNSTLFESTTAQKLADKGFYVIIYDRRGEGRSPDSKAKVTYNEAFQDLNTIYKKYHLKKATLIGHSFGGLVAALYTEKFPEKVKALVLAGALISQQETYDHILKSVKKTALEKHDTKQLQKIASAKNLNKNSAEYRKACFDLAGENDYFKIPNPTAASKKLYNDYEAGIFYKTNIRNKNAPVLFYKNEKKKNIDNKPVLQKIKVNGIPIYAIYGQNDAIFSSDQITWIKVLTGRNHFNSIQNCSHYLFVDQQEEFLSTLEKWLR